MLWIEAINEQIVNHSAFGRGQRRILRLSVNEFRGIVRDETIDEGDSIRAAHVQFAHVRDIEETCVRARPQMFLDSSGWILNRHVPPAEINHTPTHPAMHGVERSLF